MYEVRVKPLLYKKIKKLTKKQPKQLRIIRKKSKELLENPQHYKNLNAPMQHLKRVHIDKHFVLVFSVDEKEKIVYLEDYEHHKKIYKK